MKTAAFANALLELFYNGTAIPNLADNAASSPATNLYFSLHSTWPGTAGDQTTGEVGYTSYARVAVGRNGTALPVTANSVSPAAGIQFPRSTGGSATAYFWGVGTDLSGAGNLLEWGVLGVVPTVVTGATSDTITSPAHGLTVDDPVVFWRVFAASLPTGITEGTVYYVKTAPDADTFTISTTMGGSTLNITVVGVGAVQKLTPAVIASGDRPNLTTALGIKEF